MDLFSCIFPLLCNFSASQTNIVPQKYDFIIVGGGSAGSVLAGRLSENPNVNVLLLEAGGCPPLASEVPALNFLLFTSEYAWLDKTVPQTDCFLAYPNQKSNYVRGKMLGGSGSINGLFYIRGNKLDYDHWAALGNKNWSYVDILPYFKKAEGVTVPSMAADTAYHNTKGPLTVSYAPYHTQSLDAFLQSAVERGYQIRDLNAGSQSGAMRSVFTMRNGSRCSTAKAYLLPAQHRPNLVIACNSRVKEISVDAINKTATGVAFHHNGTDYYVRASKEVILSAGAFGSPQLLLLSGIGPKNQLKKHKIIQKVDLPGVGENLQDHVACGALIWTVNCTNCTIDGNKYLTEYLQQWIESKNGPVTVSYCAEGFALVNNACNNKFYDWPSVQLLFLSTNKQLDFGATFGVSNETLIKYLGSAVKKLSFLIMTTVMRPKSRGTIKLQSGDYRDAPLIDFRYLSHPNDVRTLVKGMKTAIAFGNSEAFKPLGAKLIPRKFPGCEKYQQFTGDYLECVARHYTLAQFHAAGSCKMGVASDTMSVVDSELKVYKVKNLRVVDTSIMPQIVSGNTFAAVIMIAEKAADMIKKLHNV